MRRTATPRPPRKHGGRHAEAVPADDDFLRRLYEQHGSVMLRFAARLLGGDWHRAEDVLQEAALRAWRHAPVLDPTAEALRPWLFTVVRNLVIDDHRARQARPPELGDRAVTEHAVLDQVDHVLTMQVVIEGLEELPVRQREVLIHMYYLGHSVAQTAEALGIPPGTVKSRTYHAMRALREALAARGMTV